MIRALGVSRYILVTVAKCPEGLNANTIITFLRERYGIYIASGLGPYKESVVRISHMGPRADMQTISLFLEAIGDFLRNGN